MKKSAVDMQLPVSLSVSCVNFRSNKEHLIATVESLLSASHFAKTSGTLSTIDLYLIDNGPSDADRQFLETIISRYRSEFDSLQLITGQGNIGYGRANNLAIMQSTSYYHLVLNPDVLLAPDNLHTALAYMQAHKDIALLAPDAMDTNQERQFLAKRQPSFWVLLARATRHPWLCQRLKHQLDNYEYRDLIPASEPLTIALASGCYMLLRTAVAQRIGGFDPVFFMYFEDFDLTRRIGRLGRVVHHPGVKIVHFGGGAATKGGGHTGLFLRSYIKFFIKTLLG